MNTANHQESRDVLSLLGHLFLLHGRPEQAVTVLRALCAIAPDDAHAMKALARAAIRSGQPDYAMQIIDRLSDIGDQSPVVHLMRGQACAALGRATEAERALQHFAAVRHQSSKTTGL